MEYRKATVDDAKLLAELRKAQLMDEGQIPDKDIDAGLDAFFPTRLEDSSLVEWIAEDEGRAVATGGIMFIQFPPSFDYPLGLRGYVTNMYTHPDYRKQGIATAMLHRLADEARARNVRRVWLSSSDMGKPVYEKFGFRLLDNWYHLEL